MLMMTILRQLSTYVPKMLSVVQWIVINDDVREISLGTPINNHCLTKNIKSQPTWKVSG